MPDKEPSWSLTAKQIILGAGAIITATLSTWGYISTKADDIQVKALAVRVETLADKEDVESLRNELNELSAKRREDFVMLKNISNMLETTNSKIGKIEDNQVWQIQQEAKRLQWQNFKQEPPSTPPANVGR